MPLFGCKRTLRDSGFFHGFEDCHSHLIPGVDDGVKSIEDSLTILSLYETLGVREVWCTPHVMEDVPNASERLEIAFSDLCGRYDGPVVLHLAAEYMMDHLFLQRFHAKDLLMHRDGGLLVETSTVNPPMRFEEILTEILSSGIFPILAHPERYSYMDRKDYARLKGMGVRFQMNLPSAVGFYGDDVKENARWILSQGMYDYFGTDLHSVHMLEHVMKAKKFRWLKR